MSVEIEPGMTVAVMRRVVKSRNSLATGQEEQGA